MAMQAVQRFRLNSMELIDVPSCFVRVAGGLWPCVIVAAITVICTTSFGMRKRTILILSATAFGIVAVVLWQSATTHWQLGLLESESPDANESAYTRLNQSLPSGKIWQIIQREREHPNVRFALTIMLCERGESSLLTSKIVPALERPAFFGESHLAKAAQKFEFPVEVAEVSRRLTATN